MDFSDNIVRFEALTKTSLKGVFAGIPLDRQLVLVEHIVKDFHTFAGDRKVDYRLWITYRKQVDFTTLGKSAIAVQSFMGKTKKVLDNLSNLW